MTRASVLWRFVTGCAIIGTVMGFGLVCWAASWPPIESLSEKRTFVDPGARNEDTPFVVVIRDTRGVPVYRFECHNGNYEGESEINFSGDFQCALFVLNGNTNASGNLLVSSSKDERSVDWWNRARMRSAQLRGKCLGYPEYTTSRHFKLRGMLLLLRFSDVQWRSEKNEQGDPLLREFTFSLHVVPNTHAQSSTAELLEGPKPPSSCYP